jgi:hypothetical protein
MRQKMPPVILKSNGADILRCLKGLAVLENLQVVVEDGRRKHDIEMWVTEVNKAGLWLSRAELTGLTLLVWGLIR